MIPAKQEQETAKESFLIADCGSINTTVVLFDIAAGVYRFIARATVPTTAAAPWSDIVVGIQQAIGQIAATTGRTLLNERGTLLKPSRRDGSGVDHFAAVVSAAPPLTALIAGLSGEVSLDSARRALRTTYTQEVDSFSLADERQERGQIATIVEKQPDLIFLVGGTDGGAEQRVMKLVETVGLGLGILAGAKRPQVLFAGNKNLREQVKATLGERANVHAANNVRPTLETEQLSDAMRVISQLYEEIKIDGLPGIRDVIEWSSYPLMPTAQALANIAKYFAALQKGRVLGLDVGSDSVTLVAADPEHVNLAVRSDLGMGRPIANLLTEIRPAAIAKWVSSELSEEEIRSFTFNKGLQPQTIPVTEVELHLEQAIARELIQRMVVETAANWRLPDSELARFNLLLARGGVLTNTPRPAQAILMLLDALQPVGVFSIALDHYGVLPALGALATHEPLAVVQALEAGVLMDLGWVVAPAGKGQPGQRAITVTMASAQTGQLKLDVEYGSIEVLLLTPGQAAEVSLQPTRRFDIGFGPGKGKKVTLRGGTVGLIIDARGRPLELPRDDAARRSAVRQWLWDIGG
jgi:hypothetical protein